MESFIIFVVGFILGIVFVRLCGKRDGRIVLGDDKFFVGITTSPEDMTKRKTITLKVIKQ